MSKGHSLLYALRSGAHAALGFASFAEYIERLLGYGARWTAERLRVAEALERLPHLDQALRDAGITWSAARELTRVAVRENEHQWLEVSQGRTLREVEELVSGHRSGDAPGEPTGTSSPMHILRHEVSAETDARHTLSGSGSSHVGDESHVGDAGSARQTRARQNVPPAVRREGMRRDGGRCVVPVCRNAVFLDVHHIELRSQGGTHDPDALVVLCCAHHRAAHRGALTISGRVALSTVCARSRTKATPASSTWCEKRSQR